MTLPCFDHKQGRRNQNSTMGKGLLLREKPYGDFLPAGLSEFQENPYCLLLHSGYQGAEFHENPI